MVFGGPYIYWAGSMIQLCSMINLLKHMWWTKNCSGISIESQILYALVFSTRHLNPKIYSYIPSENIIIKVLYAIVTYAIVLSMSKYLHQTYERRHDPSSDFIRTVGSLLSVTIRIGGSLLFSFIANGYSSSDIPNILTIFSTYLETVAMGPQFELALETRRCHSNVIIYIQGMALGTLLQFVYGGLYYPVFQFFFSTNGYHCPMIIVQLWYYWDFFRKIYGI